MCNEDSQFSLLQVAISLHQQVDTYPLDQKLQQPLLIKGRYTTQKRYHVLLLKEEGNKKDTMSQSEIWNVVFSQSKKTNSSVSD